MDAGGPVWKRAIWWAGLCMLIGAGCGSQRSQVQLVDVPDGTYLRGAQTSVLEIDPTLEVVRAELYLDRSRIAEDDFAPFQLGWDTRGFEDGAHDLTARVYLASGDHVDENIAIWIDNTPPAVGSTPATAIGGQVFSLDVSDNLKVAEVRVTRDVPGEPPVILRTPPFVFTWTWGCGTSTIHVRVVDAAGGEATATAKVTSTDTLDVDCDGFRPISRGGLDCDDYSAMTYPGAPEPPEGFDLNCDGRLASLPGIDSDGDGVPSISDGGNDCDDTEPTIHGDYYQFAHVALRVGDVPVTWNPGEAALDASRGFWSLYLNRGGVVEQYSSDGGTTVRQLATGANPSSIATRNGLVTFGRGNDIIILQRNAGTWDQRSVIHTSGPVGKLAVDLATGPDGIDNAVFQTGTDIWFASTSDLLSWTIEHIADLRESLVENPVGSATTFSTVFTFHTSHGVWTYHRLQRQAFQATRVGPANTAPTAMTAGFSSELPLVAVNDGSGSAIYVGSGSEPVLRTPKRVTAMAAGFPSVFLRFDDGSLEAFERFSTSTVLRHAQTITDIGAFDVANSGGFAGGGMVHYITNGSVFAPRDPSDDHVDRDCNGRD